MIRTLIVDWLINSVIASISRWLDQATPTQQLRDPAPAPILRQGRWRGHPVSHYSVARGPTGPAGPAP